MCAIEICMTNTTVPNVFQRLNPTIVLIHLAMPAFERAGSMHVCASNKRLFWMRFC